MSRKRIAIACQGGGSQCAFIAGALNTLFERGIDSRYEIVGLSGTSGGAITSAVAWQGLLKRAQGDGTSIGARVLACWKDLSAQTPREILLDRASVELVRLGERGLFPTWAVSPSSANFQLLMRATSFFLDRPEFTDLGALLRKHIDFDGLATLIRPGSPVLLVGAGDVLDGTFKIFSSAKGEIKVESLLASAAIPNLFPPVWVDGHAYWDGIFASNPPVFPFLQGSYMNGQRLPEEIWVIQVNRTHNDFVPETPSDISDRRNQLAGNLSLQHELKVLEMVNMLIQQGALSDAFRARFGLDMTETIAVRFIRMSQALQDQLDYPSKLSRQPAHIERLISDGESQAREFLERLGEVGDAAEAGAQVPVVEAVEPGVDLASPL
jgi:NTE family protein